MRPIRSLLVFLVFVFAGGALIAPFLYKLIQVTAPDSPLAHNPFHRYLNRSFLILALAGMWPLLRSFGCTRFEELGLTKPRGHWHLLGKGFLLGFVSLAAIAAAALLCGARSCKSDLTSKQWLTGIFGAMGTAVAVAIYEELLFRGALFGAIRKAWSIGVAIALSSMVYAIVHFMRSADIEGPIDWTSGFRLLPRMLAGFGDLEMLIPGFLNLTLVGVMLAFAYHRTKTLYFSIGLHGGWIFWLKFYGIATHAPEDKFSPFWGSNRLVDGWLASIILLVSLLPLMSLLKQRKLR